MALSKIGGGVGFLRIFSCIFLIVIFSFQSSNARAQESLNFCYESSCFATIEEAEVALRASVYGPYAIRTSSAVASVSATTHSTFITYTVPNVAPQQLNDPVYGVGGWTATTGMCSASGDPVVPNYCFGEGATATGFAQKHQDYYIQRGCTFTDEHFEGDTGEPFVSSRGVSGQLGALSYYIQANPGRRWYVWMTSCPGWTDKTPQRREYQVNKSRSFYCPENFTPATGYSAAHQPTGAKEAALTLDTLCKPAVRTLSIKVQNNFQTPSCAINANPCLPATGDKFRVERDFAFGGFEFIRYYHSLGLNQADGRGVGWSDSLSGKVVLSSAAVLFSEDGFLQKFLRVATDRYRGQKNHGDYLARIYSPTRWVLTRANGEIRTYDGNSGELLSIELPGGDSFIINREFGRISSVVDRVGRSLVFVYDGDLLTGIGLPDGGVFAYEYDSDRNLTKVIRPDLSFREYIYNEVDNSPQSARNLLTGIVDDGVRYATFKYDQGRRPIFSALGQDGVVDKVDIYYNAGGARVVDVSGAVRDYVFDGFPYRDISSVTGNGVSTSSVYNSAGRVTAAIDARGFGVSYNYNDSVGAASSQVVTVAEAGGRTSVITRGLLNRIVERRVSDRTGVVVDLHRYVYDSLGRMTYSCRYGVAASVYVCGSASVAPPEVQQVGYAYCESESSGCPIVGLLTTIDGARTDVSDVVRYSYYEESRCDAGGSCNYRAGDLKSITDSLGNVSEVLAYDGGGRPVSVKDTNGVVHEYEYSSRGWLLSHRIDGGGDADRVTTLEYWPTGLVSSVLLPDGSYTGYVYDSAHRLTDVLDGDGNRIHYTLDDAGNRIKEETFGAGREIKRSLSRVYDVLGRMVVQKGGDGYGSTYGYDQNGNITGTIDAQGIIGSAAYDALNRLTQSLQDVGGIAASTQFKYDTLDNITEVIDPKGLKTAYSYDGFGQLTTISSPDTGTTQRTYDAAGNLKTYADARGVTVNYTYDALNRVTSVRYPSQGEDVTYTYDTSPTSCAAGERFGIGRLSSMFDASGRTDYCYSRFGDVVRKVQVTNGMTFVMRYTYTFGGSLASVIYPNGAVADYVRDTQGRITEVGVTTGSSGRQVLLSGATYLPFGPSTGWLYGNGRVLVRSFDTDYRPTAVVDSGHQLKIGLRYDTVSNVAALESGAYTADLGYDALGRLMEFRDSTANVPVEQYSYDATGNRLSFADAGGAVPYTYEANSHRLTSIGTSVRSYDAVGNTITSVNGAKELVYNQGSRLSQVKQGSVVAQNYVYNARGERVQRGLDTASATYTAYDEAGHWLGDYDALGNATQQVIWMDDTPVGLLAGGVLHYIEADHLGTPRLVYDPMRNVPVWTRDIKGEAFGDSVPNQDPDADGQAFVFDMRFPGQRYDAASGLNYNYFRDYDPSTGRYVQSDPIGLDGGISTYGYVGGSPLGAIDPLGLVGRRVDLGDGYTGRIDQFNFRNESSFEVHVYNSRGNEVGVYGPDGWINKHGRRGVPASVPAGVENRCKSIAEDFLARVGRAGRALDRAAERSAKMKKAFGPFLGPAIEAFYPSPNRVCDPVPGYFGCEDVVQ